MKNVLNRSQKDFKVKSVTRNPAMSSWKIMLAVPPSMYPDTGIADFRVLQRVRLQGGVIVRPGIVVVLGNRYISLRQSVFPNPSRCRGLRGLYINRAQK